MKANPLVLRPLRERADLTQEQLADVAGLSQSQYSLVERGLKGTTFARFRRIARKLKVDVETLIDTEQVPA